ncbi:hypothetical protein DL96DRAFT_1578319 [Flagelloscypha sp. PMI_526]|nr:hypothetical protein DL96DRAFT_1578319 [Flagelloscypha sp. PMI_526]
MNLTASDVSQKARYLRTLPAIRERCTRVHTLGKEGKLQYFDYHPEKEPEVVDFCANIIQRDFGSEYGKIPPHGRWRHLDTGRARIQGLLDGWSASSPAPDTKEQTRRLLDLFLVSVLLDAGAGNEWGFHEKESQTRYIRSEGLGVASFHMFNDALFSSNPQNPHQVDAEGLATLTASSVALGLQANEANPMVGLDGRAALLTRLSGALKDSPEYFGPDGRPGNLLDRLEKESIEEGGKRLVPISALWAILIEGLNPIWPASRTKLGDIALGDVWPCSALKTPSSEDGDDLVPFHKLTGWLTYSLIEPIEKLLGWKFHGIEDMTGLPEYRNGGLLLDLGVLSLKPNALPIDPSSGLPKAKPSHPAIIEWRALTVIEL